MTWNDAPRPAGWVSVTSAHWANLFTDTDTPSFTLSAATAVAYEIRDYHGDVVQSGVASGTTLTPAALPLGWYRLYLFQAGSDLVYGSLIGTSIFSIIRHDARLLAPLAAGTLVSTSPPPDFAGPDHGSRGIAVLGPFRHLAGDASDPSSWITSISAEQVYVDRYYTANPDSVRPRPEFVAFPNGTAGHAAGVSSIVAGLYPDIEYFEGPINEPDPQTVVDDTQAFLTAVKAGNAAAKAMGPSCVSVNGGTIGSLEWFVHNGGAAGLDALSFHFYNCVNGDITLGRRTMTALRKMLARYGLGALPLWQTEVGTFAATDGVFEPRRQTRWAMMQRFTLEQYGVPKEHDAWFYDTSHGFWAFPSFWELIDLTVMPMIPMMRVYSQEIYGKTWDSPLDFGTVENDIYIGNRFLGGDGSATLALLSGGRTDGSVTLHVTGAASLTVVNAFGTASVIACNAHGLALVPVGLEPVYIRLPAGVDATVEQVAYGTDVARGATATAPGTVKAAPVFNGVLENWYYQDGSPIEYRDDHPLPSYVIGTFAVPQPIDTVVVHCPTPWQGQGTFLDFDVSYSDPNGVWHLIETFTEPTTTFRAPTSSDQTYCTIDSFHSGRCQFVATLPSPQMASAIRVDVRAATYGGEATAEAIAAGGQGDADGKSTLRLRELAVYCRAPTARVSTFATRS